MPAISKSEFVIVPLGFWKEITLVLMSTGHSTRHTIGERYREPESHTPPAPNLEASQYPIYPGTSTTSSLQLVGRWLKIRIRARKSVRAVRTGAFFLMRIHWTSPRRAASIGPIRPLPAGIPIHACRNLPRSFSNSFRRTCRFRAMACSSDVSLVTLSGGSSRHRLAPSKIQPSISFLVVHRPSPCWSFLIDTGSSPS
jgi:hypothetical protein